MYINILRFLLVDRCEDSPHQSSRLLLYCERLDLSTACAEASGKMKDFSVFVLFSFVFFPACSKTSVKRLLVLFVGEARHTTTFEAISGSSSWGHIPVAHLLKKRNENPATPKPRGEQTERGRPVSAGERTATTSQISNSRQSSYLVELEKVAALVSSPEVRLKGRERLPVRRVTEITRVVLIHSRLFGHSARPALETLTPSRGESLLACSQQMKYRIYDVE